MGGPGGEACYDRSNEYQLIDSAKYFLGNLILLLYGGSHFLLISRTDLQKKVLEGDLDQAPAVKPRLLHGNLRFARQ